MIVDATDFEVTEEEIHIMSPIRPEVGDRITLLNVDKLRVAISGEHVTMVPATHRRKHGVCRICLSKICKKLCAGRTLDS